MDGSRRQESFDYLILSTGSTLDYFGNEHFRRETFPLRTLEDAVQLRNHILKLFEKAAWARGESEREPLTSFVVIGGGPTGLETAGALYELYNHVLKREYQGNLKARVYLVEMKNHLLDTYPEKLQKAALDQIRDLGVNVVLGKGVQEINSTGVSLDDGSRIPARTVVWAAGVKGLQPIGLPSGLKAGRGQIRAEPTLQVSEHPGIYAVGDTAYLEREDGRPHPLMIPVAKQQGIQAAENILRAVRGQPQKDFSYHDRGGDGHHRPPPGCGLDLLPDCPDRLPGLADLAGAASDQPDRLPQPTECTGQLDLELPDLRSFSTGHFRLKGNRLPSGQRSPPFQDSAASCRERKLVIFSSVLLI